MHLLESPGSALIGHNGISGIDASGYLSHEPTDKSPSYEYTNFERPPLQDEIPFRKIMSRLPRDSSESDSEGGEDEDSESVKDYIDPTIGSHVAGTLPETTAQSGLLYTHARLPQLDAEGRALWLVLNKGLRPITSTPSSLIASPISHDRMVLPPDHPGISSSANSSQCPASKTTSQESLNLVRNLFTWSALKVPHDMGPSRFYGVVFRSRRRPNSGSKSLYAADRLAHEEAVQSGGLIMYFYGWPDPVTGENLATCIWRTRNEAREASKLPWHKEAVKESREAYGWFALERYAVIKDAGETGVRIEAWGDGE
ncbi:MAG: hypothetical protein M1820_004318 [Bogoriella megaspora]|nr:MAG: hypothetical protein M1820_004318 [Bogoriella megaspora]